jgi:signal transduction histidine kinase
VLKPLRRCADQKGLELTTDIPAVVPDHLIGDPMRLQQILINLTDNAIKFTEHGDVTLHVAVDSATDDELCLHFSVADTGIGIPATKQALIFEAFTQADGTTTRAYGGTGLGLAIASRLVRQMGGCIWVESTVGEGTTFHFTAHLPAHLAPTPDVRHADLARLNGLRVTGDRRDPARGERRDAISARSPRRIRPGMDASSRRNSANTRSSPAGRFS